MTEETKPAFCENFANKLSETDLGSYSAAFHPNGSCKLVCFVSFLNHQCTLSVCVIPTGSTGNSHKIIITVLAMSSCPR